MPMFKGKGRAIFIALHERHVEHVDRVNRQKIGEGSDGSLDYLIVSLVEGMVEIYEAIPNFRRCRIPSDPDAPEGLMRERASAGLGCSWWR